MRATFTPYQIGQEEEYMSDKQLEHFREILLQWKNNLIIEVDRTVRHLQDDGSIFSDPNDQASQEAEFTLELRTMDRERKLIKKIDNVIKTTCDGKYGFCMSCGAEIGLRRLEVRPTATQCIDCKTRDENQEKFYAR
ncbi:molecular chaperone DnaK [Candidatus Thiomargarita nelsonii]|uniref:RNA polymerase-binding transcription factor DksA n=1 Tax=Candidatus Thiomargarita nelsonii TaxID=1003181 RepID=A0A0A6PDM0_9GAMM|nr:molecular chaperone DnaK [Candidatus Thiomargarita nelsonii]